MQLKYTFTVLFKKTHMNYLTNRSIICVEGKDSSTILQGISTNNINLLKKQQSLYTGFLNTQGRLASDALIIRPEKYLNEQWVLTDNEYWLDVDKTQIQNLMSTIKKYSFRKQIDIYNLKDQIQVLQLYVRNELYEQGEQKQQSQKSEEGLYRNLIVNDPRHPQLGARIYTNDFSEIQIDKEEIILSQDDVYQAYRYYLGILEGQELENQLPFSMNLDWLNGISFDKGCYLGQELTSRSYHRGIIRKRIFGLMMNGMEVDRSFDRDVKGMSIFNDENNKIGQILINKWNVGVCSVRYLENQWWKKLRVGEDIEGKIIRKNDIKLNEYTNLVKERQL